MPETLQLCLWLAGGVCLPAVLSSREHLARVEPIIPRVFIDHSVYNNLVFTTGFVYLSVVFAVACVFGK